ncbi:MAG: LysM peptidoglycan-binding domain-containing protein [Syntrophales bacterium]|jgi:membrane-bound lytic murein transglycosylase D|nr:LysM peptidoglycan-binding domain-containing protein [Syntrophales bacterium]MCK9528230.1 LysM peptidoglycan-binding domain-containing protein [Syntrophales bacterium]MDX9921378.1 LysM peptidoglycan-binding domain-containing protein [Syntrophales bacterium]
MRHAYRLVCLAVFVLVVLTSCAGLPGGYERHSGQDRDGEETTKAVRLQKPSPRSRAGLSSSYSTVRGDAGDIGADESSDQRRSPAQECIDEALLLLNQSQEFWERGELDSALNILDQAYSLTLGINDDPDITWQRDDLRFLIAKRIIEIYASRGTVAVGRQSEIPLSTADEVEQEIRRFQNQERNFFLQSYRRSGAYRPMIVEYLKEAGLPEELSWLPLVESGFSVKAFSSARALGLWQFIPSTGYKFGLKRDQFVDERMNPERSTCAAIAYLEELHGIFGDWHTVLAAYNCGEGRVLRVISGQQINYLDNFWDLYQMLPGETKRYVPRFLATLRIISDPERYGFDLENESLDEPRLHETVITSKNMLLSDIAKHINASETELELLNAELRLKMTPAGSYEFRVPRGQGEVLRAGLEDIPRASASVAQTASVIRHQVRRGESLSSIAARYRSSVAAIARTNSISQGHIIRVGQWLRIPVAGGAQAATSSVSAAPVRHRVSRGESLSTIAARYGSSVDSIARGNNITRTHLIREGQWLTIPGAGAKEAAQGGSVPAGTTSYTVKKGDSLFNLARRFGTTVTHIRESNNLTSNLITVGQVLKVPAKGQHDGASGMNYIVQSGDSPYTIAKKFNISLHELLSCNDLPADVTIYPGQMLIIRHD